MSKARALVTRAGAVALALLTASAARTEPPGPAVARAAGPTTARLLPSRQGTLVLMAMGDVLLGGSVGRRIEKQGPAYPFSSVASLLHSADLTFANLEGPFTKRRFALHKRYLFRAEPRLASALQSAGVRMVSLSNNHAMDCGPAGLGDTMDALRSAGVQWCGAIRGAGSPGGPIILASNGLRVAFVAFTEHGPVGDPASAGPRSTRASAAVVRQCIAAARKRADVVVASFHWGIEVTAGPSPSQRRLGQAAVQAGADLVVGHHPHVIQGMQLTPVRRGARTALIAYSLGNFVFGNAGTLQSQTLVLRCRFGPAGLLGADVIPMVITAARPRPAAPAEARAILGRLAALSLRLGTRMVGPRVYGSLAGVPTAWPSATASRRGVPAAQRVRLAD